MDAAASYLTNILTARLESLECSVIVSSEAENVRVPRVNAPANSV
jgi:hypothetical protein